MKQLPFDVSSPRALALFPTLAFGGLGAYNIFSDLAERQLTAFQLGFNLIFFLPLVWRSSLALKLYSWGAAVFGVFLFWGLFIGWMKYRDQMSAALRQDFVLLFLAGLLSVAFSALFYSASQRMVRINRNRPHESR